MTHGTQVVNLIGLRVGNDGNKVGGIAQISVVKEKLDSGFVTVAVDVVDTAGVEGGGTTNDSVDLYYYLIVCR